VLLLFAGLLLLPLPAAADSLRGKEVARFDCESEVARREITLFANGTVRLRERAQPQEDLRRSRLGVEPAPGEGELLMYLGQLDPEMLDFYLDRLAREDLSEVKDRPGGMEGTLVGEWVDQCSLKVHLPGRTPRYFTFSQYDSLPLTLSRVITILKELPTYVAEEDGLSPRIPHGYAGRVGDILEHKDGNRFEVRGFTTDGGGLELKGIETPVTLFIALDDLRAEFRALLPRESPRR
jgi:hypothetical protein